MRKSFALLMVVIMLFNTLALSITVSANDTTITTSEISSPQLAVSGNKIINQQTGEAVRLTGVNVPSLEWWSEGEHVYTSVTEALDNWNANVIRLPISSARWNGLTKEQANIGYEPYRKKIAKVVEAVAERGKHVIIDCHWSDAGKTDYIKQDDIKNTDIVNKITGQHKMPDQGVMDMWVEIAGIYGNNPAVLFNIYNEPHSVSWEIWRNGGEVSETVNGEAATYTAVGHQQLVEAIRDAGAKNIIVAGGLDFAYDLKGIVGKAKNDTKVYALVDQGSNADTSKTGYGIMYDAHIYPWKNNTSVWQGSVGCVLDQYPVIIGESGWEKQSNEDHNLSIFKDLKLNSKYWVTELLNWFDNPTNAQGEETGVPLNWTVWTFHPNAQPTTFSNWYYEPTPFWGAYVKERLLSYKATQTTKKNYIFDFSSENNLVARFTDDLGRTVGGGALQSCTYTDGGLLATFSGNGSAIRMEPYPVVSTKGIQSLHMTVNPTVGGTATIGIAETDGEIWSKDVELTANTSNTINISVNELSLTPFEGANGIFTGVAASVFIRPASTKGKMTISNVLINRGGTENYGYTLPEARSNVEYVHQKDIILAGELQDITYFDSFQGTSIISFLGQGLGNVTIQLTSGGQTHTKDVSLTDSGWSHIILNASDFNLADFDSVSNISIKGNAGTTIRRLTFTDVQPPAFSPALPNIVDYNVNFEADGDTLYKLDYPASYISTELIEDSGNNYRKFVLNTGGDITFWFNPEDENSHVNLRDAKTLSFDIKGDGEYININMAVMGNKIKTNIPLILEDGNWHHYTINLEKAGVYIPHFLESMKFYMSKHTGRSFFIDNIRITSEETIAPSEDIVDSFDGENLFTFNTASLTTGKDGNGYTLNLNSPVEVSLNKNNLKSWQRDLGGLRYLSFNAKSNTANSPVKVFIQNSNGDTLGNCEFSLNSTDWCQVNYPLIYNSNAIKTNDIAKIVFSAKSDVELCIDNLGLYKNKPQPSDESIAALKSDCKQLLHDDFEGNVRFEHAPTEVQVYDNDEAGWKVYGSELAISNFGLYNYSDYLNTTNYISTADDTNISTLYYNSSNKLKMYRDFERPDNEGLTTVEMRVKYSPYNGHDIILYENSGADTKGNNIIAKITIDKDGKLIYKDEYLTPANKQNTQSSTTIPVGGWVYIRAVVNTPKKTVSMYVGNSLENVKPWTAERDTFNYSANGTASPYTQAGEGLSSVLLSGNGVASIDDVRVWHELKADAPVAYNVTVSGLASAGSSVYATYSYSDEQGDIEEGSTALWQSADDKEFTKNVTDLTESFSVSAGQRYEYAVTTNEKGKYIRFAVTPKNTAEKHPTGDEAYAVTQKVNSLEVNSVIFEKNGSDASINGMGSSGKANAKVEITNTDTEKTICVYVAEFEDNGVPYLTNIQVTKLVVPQSEAVQTYRTESFDINSNRRYAIYVFDMNMAPLFVVTNSLNAEMDIKLLAKEMFTAEDGTDISSQTAENGWSSEWRVLKTVNGVKNVEVALPDPLNNYIIKNNSMTTEKAVTPQNGYGCNISRHLETPIDFDKDSEYYIQYTIPNVVYMEGTASNYLSQSMALGYCTDVEKDGTTYSQPTFNKCSLGVKRQGDTANYMVAAANFFGSKFNNLPIEKKLENGVGYTFVMHISTRKDADDICRVKVFAENEEVTMFPLTWDNVSSSNQSVKLDTVVLNVNNHGHTQLFPTFDDIQIFENSAVYVKRDSIYGLIPDETINISVPATNEYGNKQTLSNITWYEVIDGVYNVIGEGTDFTVPAKIDDRVYTARVTLTDEVTKKISVVWAFSDTII